MPYVERNEEDAIIALYSMPQPGIAEEFLDDEDEEVTTYLAIAERQEPNVIDVDELQLEVNDHESRITVLEGE